MCVCISMFFIHRLALAENQSCLSTPPRVMTDLSISACLTKLQSRLPVYTLHFFAFIWLHFALRNHACVCAFTCVSLFFFEPHFYILWHINQHKPEHTFSNWCRWGKDENILFYYTLPAPTPPNGCDVLPAGVVGENRVKVVVLFVGELVSHQCCYCCFYCLFIFDAKVFQSVRHISSRLKCQ